MHPIAQPIGHEAGDWYVGAADGKWALGRTFGGLTVAQGLRAACFTVQNIPGERPTCGCTRSSNPLSVPSGYLETTFRLLLSEPLHHTRLSLKVVDLTRCASNVSGVLVGVSGSVSVWVGDW